MYVNMTQHIRCSEDVPFDKRLELIKQPTRQVILSVYSKPVYEFCEFYNITHPEKTDKTPTGHAWNDDACDYYLRINSGVEENNPHYINLNIFTWFHKLIAKKYIERHYKQYTTTGGRRRSAKPAKKQSARRRRSSKRKARKSRITRRR
jgi:hypothetical protein